MLSGPENIVGTSRYKLSIRQWVSQETAQLLLVWIQADVRREFSFDNVQVSLGSRDDGMDKAEGRLGLPPIAMGIDAWGIRWE